MIPKSAAMNRRRFVGVGASALFVPYAGIAVSRDAPTRKMLALDPGMPAPDHFFFDERFAEARRLARQASIRVAPTLVQGDVTSLWTGGLAHASLAAPLTLEGVTTESFYFCLKTLLLDHAGVSARVTRVDRDLHLWTIRTDNHKKGTMSWPNLSRPV